MVSSWRVSDVGSANTGHQNSKSHSSLLPSGTTSRTAALIARTSTGTLKGNKRDKSSKDKRRSRKSDQGLTVAQSPPNTQWYTTESIEVPTTPVFELRQELTPKRPLRSEIERERRLSRTSSGHFSIKSSPSTSTLRFNGTIPGNRDSIGTTDSTASEEDAIPPPLPQKVREADYCNLPGDTDVPCETTQPPSTPKVRTKPPPPEPVEDSRPPTPPPKRPPLKPPTAS
ncbi:hypothetical protein R5R35_002123 [Gryllus longicercus]|uniref:Uncharacterized protein n=1 Tax=Gryllus longicercus TaxID=2509291 RepID=A0AAN9Z914_9ORTH